ncbi:hypothetical protein MTR67_001137 [Solanum verrucosum]|uniref:Isopentenyltransferase n=1 Tax=Solanum verrucosum TaxID=315347 RepID=A0AAF0PN28_SOLVR|nr:hypothetical protein MTR67_001137 [Solanum verrucosum]
MTFRVIIVEDHVFMFKHKYDSFFIWIDVEQSVLNRSVDTRVDEMVNACSFCSYFIYESKYNNDWLVDEVRQISIPDADNTKEIRRSIGVPDMEWVLEIVTNKITHAEKQADIEPDSNFTAEDFCLNFVEYIEKNLKTQCVPIIVGGSNSFIEKLVEYPVFMFKHKYDGCFIWIDVEQSVLNRRVDTRVDEMVNAGKMNTFIIKNNKFNNKKVVFIMGTTGTEKSPVSVDFATHFRGEIINSDHMQVYKELEIVNNKITYAEKQGVRHYLLEQSVLNRKVNTRVDEMVNAGLVDEVRQFYIPDADYTKGIRRSIGVPKMAKYLREVKNIDGDDETKKMIIQSSISSIKQQSVLNRRVDTWVDEMVNGGLVDEVRQFYIPDADYTKGIQRSIGFPEMAKYLREEKNIDGDDESKKMILQASISSIKRNTRMLICNQLDKIQRLINEKMWSVNHIIATDVFKEDRKEVVDEAWRNTVLQPCLDIVERFLKNDDHNINIECT